MSQRLSINEIEFLKKALRCLETYGNAAIGEERLRMNEALTEFFTEHRTRILDTTNKLLLIREKIERIAGG